MKSPVTMTGFHMHGSPTSDPAFAPGVDERLAATGFIALKHPKESQATLDHDAWSPYPTQSILRVSGLSAGICPMAGSSSANCKASSFSSAVPCFFCSAAFRACLPL